MHWRLLTLVVICGSCIGGCGENPPQKPAEPNRDNERQAYFAAETQARKDRLKPLIEALDAFSIERHQPPDSLDELISGNYVEEIPNLRVTADHNGESNRVGAAIGVIYQKVDDTDYTLEFGYHLEPRPANAKWHQYHTYSSKTKSWSPTDK